MFLKLQLVIETVRAGCLICIKKAMDRLIANSKNLQNNKEMLPTTQI